MESKNNPIDLNDRPKIEAEVLKFWKRNKIFEKSLNKEAPRGNFIFYDGPPYATGEPHHGHMIPSTLKDIYPRFKTMQGYHVDRRWGWDCHGLPIENLIEKQLGINSKQEIEDYGIDKFNELARNSVLKLEPLWKRIIDKLGRWVDMDNAYKTMEPWYMETIWWSLSELNKKGLVYKSYRVMYRCPRCETSLANHEVSQGYTNLKDISVVAKFKVKGSDHIYALAWTTTPWTLPGNVALAVNKDINYVFAKVGDEIYILSKNSVERILKDVDFEIEKEVRGG